MKWIGIRKLENEKSIELVQNKFGIKFPPDFIEVVKKYNAGRPTPSTYDTARLKGKDFGELLNFNLDQSFNIMHEYEQIKNRLPESVIPIAGDPGGNYLCYDFRSTMEPKIKFWDHEMKFSIVDDYLRVSENEYDPDNYFLDEVADDIRTLLDSLYGEEEEELRAYDDKTLDFFESIYNDIELRELGEDTLSQLNARRKKRGLPLIGDVDD